MSVRIITTKVPFEDSVGKVWVDAFCFVPEKKRSNALSVFTHGFTSHKGSILNWSLRLAEEGIPGILFDLPGHYLGCFTEVSDFENFTKKAPELFPSALEVLLSELHGVEKASTKLIIGGHSLGALLSLKALQEFSFNEYEMVQAVCVGFGMPPQGVTHIFDTPFYKSTLAIRAQLVSPALNPDSVFPWIKTEKEKLSLTGRNVYLLTGEDDVVVGKDGTERLREQLSDLGNNVALEKPQKLAHHLPENAAPHIKKWLKDQGFFA